MTKVLDEQFVGDFEIWVIEELYSRLNGREDAEQWTYQAERSEHGVCVSVSYSLITNVFSIGLSRLVTYEAIEGEWTIDKLAERIADQLIDGITPSINANLYEEL